MVKYKADPKEEYMNQKVSFNITNKSDLKLDMYLINMKDMQPKRSDIEDHNKEVGENLRRLE